MCYRLQFILYKVERWTGQLVASCDWELLDDWLKFWPDVGCPAFGASHQFSYGHVGRLELVVLWESHCDSHLNHGDLVNPFNDHGCAFFGVLWSLFLVLVVWVSVGGHLERLLVLLRFLACLLKLPACSITCLNFSLKTVARLSGNCLLYIPSPSAFVDQRSKRRETRIVTCKCHHLRWCCWSARQQPRRSRTSFALAPSTNIHCKRENLSVSICDVRDEQLVGMQSTICEGSATRPPAFGKPIFISLVEQMQQLPPSIPHWLDSSASLQAGNKSHICAAHQLCGRTRTRSLCANESRLLATCELWTVWWKRK